ncbi:MAG: glutathione S-transferase family protein [Pseudoxanthomonas sp.]
MLKLHDYLPSRNAWKVRQLLHHLGLAYQSIPVSIFEGQGRSAGFLRVNPAGKVPALELEDGRTLAESNAILAYLADGSDYLPADRYLRAKVHQWLSFEQEQVEMSIGALRYWTLTGKLSQRDAALVAGKRKAALRTLGVLDNELATRRFMVDDHYSIADISIFAYAGRAEDAGLSLVAYPHFRAWLERVQSQPGFLPEVHPYSIDPHSTGELP